jgi:hypothetical protein
LVEVEETIVLYSKKEKEMMKEKRERRERELKGAGMRLFIGIRVLVDLRF